MTATIFVDIDKIPGDATDANHRNWIAIQSMSFELERTIDMQDLGSNQRSHSNTQFQKVEMSSTMGSASNQLMQSVTNGTVFPEITLHICRSSGNTAEGLKPFSIWTFSHVIIDKYSVSFSEDGIPEESWVIAYTRVEHKYNETDPRDGKMKEINKFNWNLREGKAV